MSYTTTINDTVLDKPPPFVPTGFYRKKGWKAVSTTDIECLFEILKGDAYTLFILEKLHDDKELYFSAKFKNLTDDINVDIEIFEKSNEYVPGLTHKNVKSELFYYDKTWFTFDKKSMSFTTLSDNYQLSINEHFPLLSYTARQFN